MPHDTTQPGDGKRSDPRNGVGDYRLPVTGRAHAPYRAARHRIEREVYPGDKVAMWYISGNRDSDEIEEPDRFVIGRPQPRHHLSIGFGIHRCVGNRLAEMQLTILWEEILKRFPPIEVFEKQKRAYSNLIHGITQMNARIPT
jgi:cytochrome P450